MVTSTVLPIAAASGTVVMSSATYWVLRMYGFGVRYWRLNGVDARRAHRDAAYIRRSYKQLFYLIGLYLKDKRPTRAPSNGAGATPQVRIRYPKLKSITSDDYGVVADFKLVPKVTLKSFQDSAEDFANYWQMVRVNTIQTEPNRVRVRAVRKDPLLAKTIAVLPEKTPQLDSFPAGVDDFGDLVDLRVRNGSGFGVFGLPRYGKTSLILGLITYFAPNPSIVFLIADGKSTTGHEGDYLDVAPRALSVIGNDLQTFNTWIKQIELIRRMRAATMRQARGVRNFWDAGPTPEWPLIMPIIDECHNFFDIIPSAGNPEMQYRNSIAADNAHVVADITRMGAGVGIIPVLSTQKSTGDGIPTMIRDNLHSRICFAVSTDEVSFAALGKGIRQFPDANPINYQHEDFVGVATMRASNRTGYVRVRTPLYRDQVAAAVCERYAHLVRPESCPGITAGTEHRAIMSAEDASGLLNIVDFDKD